MSDPFSIAVSVLSVTEVAASCCGYIYKTLRSFSEAPGEIVHQITTVQALQSTFAGIASLEAAAPDVTLITPQFRAQLEACTCELQSMERLIQSFQRNIEKGKARKTWAKMRWSSPDQRETIKRYLRRIESYHRAISLDLLLLNARIAFRSMDTCSSIPEKQCYSSEAFNSLTHQRSSQGPQSPSLAQHLSIRSSICRYFENDFLRLLIWLGPIFERRRQSSERQTFNTTRSDQGYGITLAAAIDFYRPMRVELSMYLLKSWNEPTVDFSINWSLSCPRVVSQEDDTFKMAFTGEVSAIQERFSKRFSTPNDTCLDGWSLLHIAASHGHVELIKLLLQEGARVNAVSDYGHTPLHASMALSKNYDASRILLEYGADLHNRDAGGKTPLHTFASPVLEQILQSNESSLDLSLRDNDGRTLLHYLAWSSKTSVSAFEKYHKRSARDIQTATISADAKGCSPLHLAAQRGNVPIVEYILASSANPSLLLNSPDNSGETPLHHAIESRKRAPSIITALISHGADASIKNHQGWTPLRYASLMQNSRAVQAFEESGFKVADHYRSPSFGYFLYDSALRRHESEPASTTTATKSTNVQETLPSPPPQHSHYNVPYTPKKGLYTHYLRMNPRSYRDRRTFSPSISCNPYSTVIILAMSAGVCVGWTLFFLYTSLTAYLE